MKVYDEIIKIKQTGNFKLLFIFNDETQREIDFYRYLLNNAGVFKPLRSKKEFQKYKVDMAGGISWDCGADLSAETIKQSKKF